MSLKTLRSRNPVRSFSSLCDSGSWIARQLASRLATFQDRPGSHGIVPTRQVSHTRQLSGHSSNTPQPSRPVTPALSPTFLKDQKRNRSTSLMGPPPQPSPTREKSSFFGLNKKTTPNPTTAPTPTVVSPMKAIPHLRSPSPLDPGIRNSFGLPTISPDNGKFSGLGWSPSKPSQNLRHASDPYARPNSRHSRNGSASSISSNVGLGIGIGGDSSMGFTSLLRRKSSDGRSRKSSGGNSIESGSIRSTTRKEKLDRRRKAISMVSPTGIRPAMARPTYGRTKSEMQTNVDAAAGWRGERTLYQCACVAYL